MELFDFSSQTDLEVTSLHIAQSWIKPSLNEAFFYGIDATKGGGKTTLGEIVFFLVRHGFVGGNISSAAMVRLIDDLDLNIFVDELDQKRNDEDLMGTFRQGQRRGNPYVRCEGRDNHPVSYNTFGCHGYSFRSDIEDAFMDRSLRIHTQKSMDYQLPVINSEKAAIIRPLVDQLFFWYLDNFLVVTCSKEGPVLGTLMPKQFNRHSLFNDLTQSLSVEEKQFISTVFGRDNEIAFLCLKTAKRLGIDILENLKEIMQRKKEDQASAEGFYLEFLREYIVNKMNEINNKKLKDGINIGCAFYPKNRLFQGFVKHLKDLDVVSIGTKKFSSMLRDLGFIEGLNLCSQRYENYPIPCLIFTDDIKKKIGIQSNEDYSK